MNTFPSQSDIESAHQRIHQYVHRTPVLTSQFINDLVGANLFFKAENFQKIGAFKARGALNAALVLPKNKLAAGLCTHSSGNHAQAVAYAAAQLGTKAYIVMPRTAKKVKLNAVRDYGAEIILCEPTQQAREETVLQVQNDTGAHFIHPYNDYRVIEGQATAARELINSQPKISAILAPVGGGGLLSGTCLAAKYVSQDIQVFGAEPETVNDAWQSMQQETIAPSTGKVSIADGLLTSLGDLTCGIIRQEVAGIITVPENDIAFAMQLIWERMKIIIEPSSAVPLAAIINNKELFVGKNIGIILTGGNVDFADLPFNLNQVQQTSILVGQQM